MDPELRTRSQPRRQDTPVAAEVLTWGPIDRPILLKSLDGSLSWEEGSRAIELWPVPHHRTAMLRSPRVWDLSESEGRLTLGGTKRPDPNS